MATIGPTLDQTPIFARTVRKMPEGQNIGTLMNGYGRARSEAEKVLREVLERPTKEPTARQRKTIARQNGWL